jgi:hypothetical protein
MDRIKVTRTSDSIVLENNLFRYKFSQATAGFPSSIGFADGTELMGREKPIIYAVVNGKRIHPSMKSGFAPVIYEDESCTKIIMDNIGWEDGDGNPVKDYRLAHYYEVYSDGVAFDRTFFFTDTMDSGTIEAFVLSPGITLPQGTDANWSYWEYPDVSNAKIIQAMQGFERNLAEGVPATAIDIDSDGGLVVRYRDGSVQTLNTGEISIRTVS